MFALRLVSIPLAASVVLAPTARAQRPDCTTLTTRALALGARTDSAVSIYATLGARNAVLPRWYLDATLQELSGRFRGEGSHYDPVLDVGMSILVTRHRGAEVHVSTPPDVLAATKAGKLVNPPIAFGAAPVVGLPRQAAMQRVGQNILLDVADQVYNSPSAIRPGSITNGSGTSLTDVEKEHAEIAARAREAAARQQGLALPVDETSPMSRLVDAVNAAAKLGTLPALPPNVPDSVVLILQLRPMLDSAVQLRDSSIAWLPLFKAASLHADRGANGFYEGELDAPPARAMNAEAPRLPDELSNRRLTLVLQYEVDETGQVDPTSLAARTNLAMMAAPIFNSVRNWRFTPATFGGCPVRSVLGVGFIFGAR